MKNFALKKQSYFFTIATVLLLSILLSVVIISIESNILLVFFILSPLLSIFLWRLNDIIKIKNFLLSMFIISLGLSADIPLIDIDSHSAWTRLGVVYLSDILLTALLMITIIIKQHKMINYSLSKDAWLVFIAYGIFSCWQLSTVIYSIDPKITGLSMVQLIRGGVILYTLFYAVNDIDSLKIALYSLLFIAFFNGGWAILQQVHGGSFGLSHLGERVYGIDQYKCYFIDRQEFKSFVSGFIGMPYRLGAFLMLITPCFWAFLLGKRTSYKEALFMLLGIVFCTVAIYLSYSRAIWCLYALSVLFVIFMLSVKRRIKKRYFFITLVFMIALLAFNFDILYGRFFYSNLASSLDSRLVLFEKALNILKDNWLIGSGFGASSRLSYTTIHSVYLLCLVESGLIGFVIKSIAPIFMASTADSIVP